MEKHALQLCSRETNCLGLQGRFCKLLKGGHRIKLRIPIASTKDSSTISVKEAPSWRRIVAQPKLGKLHTAFSISIAMRWKPQNGSQIVVTMRWNLLTGKLQLWSGDLRSQLRPATLSAWRYSFLWTLPCARKYFESKVSIGGLSFWYRESWDYVAWSILRSSKVTQILMQFPKGIGRNVCGLLTLFVEHEDINRAHNLSYVKVLECI